MGIGYAYALVQSVLLLMLGGAIAFVSQLPEQLTTRPFDNVLGEESNCAGVKLNYPRVIEETLPNGKTDSFQYNCVLKNFRATSYDRFCPGCNEFTATGTLLTHGVCAVDPKVIPLGTSFYVPGYGVCRAEDTGGKVKGKKIDLGFEDVKKGWWSARWTDILLFVK